jgi:hypothetical protein
MRRSARHLLDRRMKLLTEYLDRAINLERLAASEQDSKFKTELLNQAAAYRKRAAKRAEQYGLPPPSPPRFQTENVIRQG